MMGFGRLRCHAHYRCGQSVILGLVYYVVTPMSGVGQVCFLGLDLLRCHAHCRCLPNVFMGLDVRCHTHDRRDQSVIMGCDVRRYAHDRRDQSVIMGFDLRRCHAHDRCWPVCLRDLIYYVVTSMTGVAKV